MSIDRAVMMFAGIMILASLALGVYVSPWWFLLTAFVGGDVVQASRLQDRRCIPVTEASVRGARRSAPRHRHVTG